jgi:hypothetical protein
VDYSKESSKSDVKYSSMVKIENRAGLGGRGESEIVYMDLYHIKGI